jgi:hypothetical protein
MTAIAARLRRGTRRCWRLLAAACVLATVPVLAGPVAADAAQSMSAAAVTAMWTAYGNAGGHWTGADGTSSVPLPDGRVAWLFADTYLGAVNPDLSRPASSPMVHNTLVVQDGAQLTDTRYGGTAAQSQSLVGPTSGDEWYWPNDGTVGGGQLLVLFNRYTRTGSGPLDFQLAGTALASFSLPALGLVELRQLPLGGQIGWGSALLDDGAYTYIYGTEATQDLRFAHVARVPLGALGGAWDSLTLIYASPFAARRFPRR